MENYTVIKLIYKEDENYPDFFIINNKDITEKNLSDTYDNYGQQIGSYAAGDYTIADCADCRNKFVKDAKNKFCVPDNAGFDVCDLSFYVDGEKYEVKGLDKFLEKWKNENESFVKCKTIDFFNGNNMQSVVFWTDVDIEGIEYEEVDLQTSKKIIREYKEYKESGAGEQNQYEVIYKGKNYNFSCSRWQDAFGIDVFVK